MGYIDKRRKRGTIVTYPTMQQSFTMNLSSFGESMKLIGRAPSTNVLVFKKEEARPEAIEQLVLDPKKSPEVYKLVRLRYAENFPNVFVETYIPCELYPTLDSYDFEKCSLYKVMKDLGNPVVSAHRSFEALAASPAVAALLDIEIGGPVILFETASRNAEKRPIEYSIARYRGSSNRFGLYINHMR